MTRKTNTQEITLPNEIIGKTPELIKKRKIMNSSTLPLSSLIR